MSIFSKIRSFYRSLLAFLTVADKVLILVLLTAGIIGFILLFFVQTPGETVQVFVNNKLAYQYDLNQNKTFLISTATGFMKIRIENGKARVKESSCPAKLCIKMGKIAKQNQYIVCVPNRVFIRIKGEEKTDWIDAVTK